MLPVPPPSYAGTERIVAVLADVLHRRGHQVTLFAPGDSQVACELVPTLPRSLWRADYRGDVSSTSMSRIAKVWAQHERFDIIHSHVETLGFLFARYCPTPVVTTLHGRLDVSGIPDLLREFDDIPLVAISESQRRWDERANWVATIHHGLPLDTMPFGGQPGDYLAFVGRITAEKGSPTPSSWPSGSSCRSGWPAKVYDEHEKRTSRRSSSRPIDDGIVEFLGELGPAEARPAVRGRLATLMLGGWPEPFGLVAIESLATGTPVIARRAGALTETVEHGVDGFLIDDLSEAELAVERVGELDRAEIRRRAIERFSPDRMADEYEAVFRSLLRKPVGRAEAPGPAEAGEPGEAVDPASPARRSSPASPARRSKRASPGPDRGQAPSRRPDLAQLPPGDRFPVRSTQTWPICHLAAVGRIDCARPRVAGDAGLAEGRLQRTNRPFLPAVGLGGGVVFAVSEQIPGRRAIDPRGPACCSARATRALAESYTGPPAAGSRNPARSCTSRMSVLISITSRVRRPGWNARMSITPRSPKTANDTSASGDPPAQAVEHPGQHLVHRRLARVEQPVQLAGTPAGHQVDPDIEGLGHTSDGLERDCVEMPSLDA